MNKKNVFATLLTLLALLLQSLVVPQRAAAAVCDAAQFVADITVPDGKLYNAGDTFDKVWRLKNVGTCTWNGSYTLSFFSGEQMGASASAPFPNQNVAPGQTVDLTVKMTAPNINGRLRGNWKLKNVNGTIFGIGANADKPFWVEIRVNTGGGTGTGTVYNFAENIGSATWTNGPGTRVDNPKLEDGSTFNGAGLLMVPPNTYNSIIQGEYPAFRVQSGDRFQSIINCEYQATACYVNFRLDYKIGAGTIQTFRQFNERYEGLYYPADWDLSSLAGQDVKFILRVGAAGYATGDRALWGAPRITRPGGTPSSPTPTVTGTPPTPTRTPVPSSGADRATFMGETIPDGTIFGPNTAFTKTWTVKNTGTSTWTTAFKLVFVSGDQLGTTTEVPLPSTVPPNTTFKLPPVNMTSPSTNGRYIGYWMLQNAAGARFGIGARADKPWWVEIVVTGGSNFTSTPTRTGTPPTPTATTTGPTRTPTPNTGPDRASFVLDVSVPDGTTFLSNATFTKTWRIRNVGTSTWTTAYKLVFDSGDQMGGVTEKNLTANVAPNGTVDLSVDLTAPANNGRYRGYWMLKNPSGAKFGIGTTFNRPFWVDINASGAPSQIDLVVSSAITAPQGWTGGCATNLVLGVNVQIKNLGTSNAGPFVVDVSGTQQTVSAGLAAGASVTLWFGKTGSLAITADSTNQVAESNENNNSLSYVTITATPPVTCTPGATLTPTVTSTPTLTLTPTSPTSSWLTYANQKYKFQFKYPPQAQISEQTDNTAHIEPLPIAAGTNLIEKYLDVNVVENASSCTSPLTAGHAPGSFTSIPVSINGTAFIKESGSDSGAGNTHKWTAYSTTKGNACISVSFVLHSTNPDLLPTPPSPFNEATESAVFTEIMATFGFTQ